MDGSVSSAVDDLCYYWVLILGGSDSAYYIEIINICRMPGRVSYLVQFLANLDGPYVLATNSIFGVGKVDNDFDEFLFHMNLYLPF